jgi:hypothetical protein
VQALSWESGVPCLLALIVLGYTSSSAQGVAWGLPQFCPEDRPGHREDHTGRSGDMGPSSPSLASLGWTTVLDSRLRASGGGPRRAGASEPPQIYLVLCEVTPFLKLAFEGEPRPHLRFLPVKWAATWERREVWAWVQGQRKGPCALLQEELSAATSSALANLRAQSWGWLCGPGQLPSVGTGCLFCLRDHSSD